jgi:conjugal transfer pilus assembly protein TraF
VPEPAPAAPPPPPAPVAPPPPPVETHEATPAGPTPLSSEWLEANLEGYRRRAIDDPSPDNVRAFLLLQRVAMDKAQTFANAVQEVTLGDPLLDATFERPLAPFATQAVDREAFEAKVALLNLLSDELGLVFFYRSDCPYCDQQAPVLEALTAQTGLEVLPVALDGAPMPSGAYAASFVPDRGQAAAFGVTTTPTLFLLRPRDGEARRVAEGLLPANDLMERVLMTARQMGAISEEAWEATRPYTRRRSPLAPHDIDTDVLDDPARLVAHLRARMGEGG